ncbi:lipopolysaccharide biosynthesis protein [Methylotuvimicrobium sp.]|uniref:lipopolysaccharide biosynthesis protein n=1 Tax=Methylotuvimicrobium sp. TaxID=2822413 RepID=UPI003D655B3C
MNIGQSIRKGTTWVFTGSLIGRVYEFAFGVILARLLLPSDFGTLVTVQVFTGAAGFIAGGGMGQALVQRKDIEEIHFHVVFTLQFIICLLIYLFFFSISPYFAKWFDNPIYEDLLRVSALTFLFRPFNNVAGAKLRRAMNFKTTTIIGLFSGLLSGACSITLAIYDFGVWSLVLGGLFGLIISIPVLLIFARFLPRIRYDFEIAKQVGGYGIRFSINDIISYLREQTPNFLIGKLIDTQAVGLFNKGYSLSVYPVKLIAGSAYQTVFRALSSTQDNLDKSKYIYLRTITLVCVYTFPFYIGLIWLADPFITTLYGEKWRLAATPLQIFCLARILSCFGNPSGAVMAAQDLLGTEIKIQIFTLLMTIAGCWFGIQQKNINFIAWGMLPSFFFLYISVVFFACKRLNVTFTEFIRSTSPALFLSFCLIIILTSFELFKTYYPLEQNNLAYIFSMSTVGGLTYGLLFLFLPIPSLKTEQNRWKKKIRIRP